MVHGVAVIDVLATPVVSKFMADQIGLARGAESCFVRVHTQCSYCKWRRGSDTDGAAIKIASAEHLDQVL